MHVRIGRDDHGPIEIGGAERCVFRPAEGEIHEPVIDEVDRVPAEQQASLLIAKLARIGDYSLDTVLTEQALREQKLRIEILLGRTLVDDGDPPWPTDPPLQPPFLREHAQHSAVEIVGLQLGDIGLGTTGALRLGERRIQEGTAGVAVDFDESSARLPRGENRIP